MPLIAIPPRTSGSGIVIAVRWPPAECPEIYSRVGSAPYSPRCSASHRMERRTSSTMRSSRAAGASVYSRKIDPEREQCRGEEGETLLYEIVYLPIAAVDERRCRRARIGSEKQIEPLARSVAIGKIKMAGNFAPHPGAACGPVGDNRVALRDRRGVVVGGIDLGTVHSAGQHGSGSGNHSVEVDSHSSLPPVRRQPIEPHAGRHKGDQRRLIATAPVVTRYS